MLSVQEALDLIGHECAKIGADHRDLLRSVGIHDALGCRLAEDIKSDIDSPPHDKSIVDGYAVVAEGLAAGAELRVLEEVTAGLVPTRALTSGAATRIMTGAPLPAGTTAVVMVEKTELVSGDAAKVRIFESPRNGQNIVRKGTSLESGETVLRNGELINPASIGLLAEVGYSNVKVRVPPTVAVLATGNEIVPVDIVPGPGQIRNSNGPMLEALVRKYGATVQSLGVAPDEPLPLADKISRGLEADFLVISGGVSAGVLDLVPAQLAALGVRQVFHKVSIKPGKPIWFGVYRKQDGSTTLVFGLPGNPVSSFVCFQIFVLSALNWLGVGLFDRSIEKAQLANSHYQRGERPMYWPAELLKFKWGNLVTLLPSKGSGDLKTLAGANCLAFFPGEEREFKEGEAISVRLI